MPTEVQDINKQVALKLLGYRADPVGFYVDVLGIPKNHIWFKMEEIALSVANNRFTLVKAAHSVSKTYGCGRLVPWFKTCFEPSTVITTAPNDNLVRNQLWREIRAAIAGSKIPLGGNAPSSLMWDKKPSKEILEQLAPSERLNWEKNFAHGFATSPDTVGENVTKAQGWHNEWFLLILDEACGVMSQIWNTAIQSLIIDGNCRFLAIGNCTDPTGEFYRYSFHDDADLMKSGETYTSNLGFNIITVSVMDTPNYKSGKTLIPGIAGREFEETVRNRWGDDSDEYRVRILGQFPESKEGTYFGRAFAKLKRDGRLGEFPYDPCYPVYTFNDFGDMYNATIFCQFIRDKIYIIDDYWDNEGMGLPAWANVLQSKGFVYREHYTGPDQDKAHGSNKKNFQTGKYTVDRAAELGFPLTPIDKQAFTNYSFDDGIKCTVDVFPKVHIHQKTCATCVTVIENYGKKRNVALSTPDNPSYHNHPKDSWHKHMADALRHMGIVVQNLLTNDEYYGTYDSVKELKQPTVVNDPMSWI